MTHTWLTIGLKQPRIPEFYTLTKIHKKTPVGRPIVSGSNGPTERIYSFVDSLLQPIAIKQESYIKDITDFINFIENTQIPDVILATLDVSSLHTNIPQEEGIDIVCHYYDDHYEQKLPIPTSDLRELMQLIIEENSFKFNDQHLVQTHGIAMGTKMAVAFSIIFVADLEKGLLAASLLKPFFWKRFIDDIFSLWNIPMEEVSIFVNFANSFHPIRSNLLLKYHPNELVFSTQRYSKDLAFQLSKFSIHKPTSSPLKLFSIHTSHPATRSILKRRSITSF